MVMGKMVLALLAFITVLLGGLVREVNKRCSGDRSRMAGEPPC